MTSKPSSYTSVTKVWLIFVCFMFNKDTCQLFKCLLLWFPSEASQALSLEYDATPELFKQTLSLRKHKHHSSSIGESESGDLSEWKSEMGELEDSRTKLYIRVSKV